MTYGETLKSHRGELLRLKTDKEPFDLADIFRPIDWAEAEANKPFLAWLIRDKLVTRRDVEDARRCATACVILGEYPKTCCAYVGAFVRRHGVSVSYEGEIALNDVHTGARRYLIITELSRNVRVMSSELGLPFGREALNDAVDLWYHDARADRLDVIRGDLAPEAEFDWVELALRCFDCSAQRPEFVAAVLRKFVHQVIRKLHGRKVGHHLMPVLLGAQGIGKTWFLHRLTSPIAELVREADFRAIGDDRNIALWRSFVLVIDEMAFAERSDIETVKHVISADSLDRRPMRTNDVVRVAQRATLIGASNKTIAELIRDDTGIRRFVGVEYRADADREYLARVDWEAAWRSVSADDPDPMDEFRDELAALQAESRHVSPVEAWLIQLSPTGCTNPALLAEPLLPEALYEDFLSHFHRTNDGQRAKSLHAWQQELGRLTKAQNADHAIYKHKTKAGNHWRWRSHLTLVEGARAA